MLELKYLIRNIDEAKERTARRGIEFDFDRLLGLDETRRDIITRVEELKAHRNEVSKEIGKVKKAGGDIAEVSARMKKVGEEIAELDRTLDETQTDIDRMLLILPNLVDADIPVGADESANTEYRQWGAKPTFSFEPKAHWEIAEQLKLVDFERGVKIAKSRFSVYTGMGARLERALINFMLDVQTGNGYTEIMPPLLVNPATMTGTGQLPKFQEDLFMCERDDLYLIPTAEVPVTNLRAGEILDAAELPQYFTAYTPCFRREAGAAGKDTRGLIRQHQFNKVELVKLVEPEHSDAELEKLLENAEEILQKLNLHYRVVTLCSGDIGFSAAKTYDIEVWVPGQDCYREISSCSNFRDFQARRANIRYRPEASKKPEFVHTLNGSGLAVGRTFLAILENCQHEDGSVTIPEVLVPYMGGITTIAPDA